MDPTREVEGEVNVATVVMEERHQAEVKDAVLGQTTHQEEVQAQEAT